MGELDGDPEQCMLFLESASLDSNGDALVEGAWYGLLSGQAQVSFLFTLRVV